MRNASLCPLPAIEWISMFLFLSVSTCLSVTVSNLAVFSDLARRSGLSVRGAAHACSKYG